MGTELPSAPLPRLRPVELTAEHEKALQRFFDANPAYFLAVHGEPAHPNEAHDEIHGELPAGWRFTRKWLIGYFDAERGELAAFANVVSDIIATHFWHIGLFLVATPQHGSGIAQLLYRSLESWAVSNGAHWLRLGVVKGNVRAERFWERLGYIETRTRTAVKMGRRTNTLRVMVKSVAGQPVEQYLSLVERDRPEP